MISQRKLNSGAIFAKSLAAYGPKIMKTLPEIGPNAEIGVPAPLYCKTNSGFQDSLKIFHNAYSKFYFRNYLQWMLIKMQKCPRHQAELKEKRKGLKLKNGVQWPYGHGT